jgi:UDP-GlcNAc:undecaprenyl-phosphate GlcNAc-1-phosphate transferase
MNLGHGHRRSVLILWTWTALLSAFVLYPVLTDQNPEYLPFGMAALAIALFTLLHPSVIEQRRRNSTPPEGIERPDEVEDVHLDQPTLFDTEHQT